MRKFSNIFNPIIEDTNYYKYQKLVESTFDYMDSIENICSREEVLSMLAYLARQVYEFGFVDGLIIEDSNVELVEKDKIYN